MDPHYMRGRVAAFVSTTGMERWFGNIMMGTSIMTPVVSLMVIPSI
jgi:hypothetical protein